MKALFRSLVVLSLFVFFGCGALIINFIIFPLGNIFVKKENRRKCFCTIIHKTWRFFNVLMQNSGSIRVEIQSLCDIEKIKGRILVANHPSFIDIVLLIGILPNTVCIAKKELRRNFFMGNIVKSLYLINDEDNEKLLKDAAELLGDGYNIIIFPTGTRTSEGEKLKLHKGAAMMAIHTKTDLLPIHIKCDSKFLAKNQRVYEAGEKIINFKITFHDEIKIENFTKQELTDIQLRNRVNNSIKEKISSPF